MKRLFNQVGSFYPVRENFRLTRGAKAKFTAKVDTDSCDLNHARRRLASVES